MSVHAVILAGGYGTRMRPLSERRPKLLLPIGDEPVIAHQLHRLARAGVETVTLATAYHADAFRPVLGDGAAYGVHLEYAREETPLGTGGALRHACSGLALEDDDVLVVINGDLVTEHDLVAHVAAHRAGARPLATIHTRHVPDARTYGLLRLDGDRVVAFEEKPARACAGFVNAGTYVLSPALLEHIGPGAVSLEREVFPALARTEPGLRAHVDPAPFHDIGTPAALLEANLAWARERGERNVVLAARVATDADLDACLVLPGAVIEAGARCRASIIGPGAHVDAGARLAGVVLGDDASVSAGADLADVVLDVGERR